VCAFWVRFPNFDDVCLDSFVPNAFVSGDFFIRDAILRALIRRAVPSRLLASVLPATFGVVRTVHDVFYRDRKWFVGRVKCLALKSEI
jgi:membrane glycosyltransferase